MDKIGCGSAIEANSTSIRLVLSLLRVFDCAKASMRPCRLLTFSSMSYKYCPTVRAYVRFRSASACVKKMTLPLFTSSILYFKSDFFIFLRRLKHCESVHAPLYVAYIFSYVLQILSTSEGVSMLSRGQKLAINIDKISLFVN